MMKKQRNGKDGDARHKIHQNEKQCDEKQDVMAVSHVPAKHGKTRPNAQKVAIFVNNVANMAQMLA